ncbi:MAG: transglycosylase domain-containing protein [Clostridiaceae bacterium]
MKSSSKPASNGAAKKQKKPSFLKKFIFTAAKSLIVFLLVLGCSIAGLAGGAVYGYIKTAEPITAEQLGQTSFNKTTFIYDSKGNVIQKLTGKDNMDSEWLLEKDAPLFLKNAIIAIEDERFYSNPGIDIQGIVNAGIGFMKSLFTGSDAPTRGGSTITQQVVKNITQNDRRSLERKVQEAYLAVKLQREHLEKWQILELYMNISYMGNSCTGVQSASKKYFGKPVQELSLAQCALLAGITKGPGTYNPFTEKGRISAKNRQETILAKMLELKMIDQAQFDQAIAEDLKYAPKSQSQKVTSVQSYFVDQVISDVKKALVEEKHMSSTIAKQTIYGGGLHIYTTLDPDIQSAMDQVFKDDTYFPLVNKTAEKQQEHPQAAMAIVDVQNGQVRALYGGYGEKKASNTLNRASSSLMQRQPGSSIKPIAVYAPAIDAQKITPATIIDDVPVYMLTGKDAEREYPRNYDDEHDGLTTVRNGLKNSVNVVAASIWRDWLGPDLSIEYLKKVGINRENEKYLSLVMGGLEKGVNPLQMASAYVPFANRGMYFEPTTFTQVTDNDGKEILKRKPNFTIAYSEQTAFIMADMMKEVTTGRTSTYPHSGTAASYVNEKTVGMTVAGKTGTTTLNVDKWFVGYTPYYAAATWYGYDNTGSEPITLKTAEYYQAMKIWAAVMKKVHEGLPDKDFDEKPANIVEKKICIYSGKIATALCEKDPRGNATRTEYFIKGTEPRDDDICTVHVEAKVCTASQDTSKRNLLAGEYCPAETVVSQVFIQRNPPYVPVMPDEKQPKDIIYELPAGEYCTVHGAPPVTEGSGSGLGIINFIENIFNPKPKESEAQPTPGSSTQAGEESEGISTGR